MSLQVLEDVSGNAVLNLINDGSLSLLDGMDALLLKYLWRRAGHPDRNLASALQGLLEAGLIEVVPGPDMAVRLSTRAFAALQQAWRAAPGSAAEGDDSPDWDSVEQGPVQAGGMGAARSELQLRLHVIGIYAELSVPANGRISAASMAHIWAQLRHRGEELRHSLRCVGLLLTHPDKERIELLLELGEAGRHLVASCAHPGGQPAAAHRFRRIRCGWGISRRCDIADSASASSSSTISLTR